MALSHVNKILSEPKGFINFASVISPSQNSSIGKRGKMSTQKRKAVDEEAFERERERDRSLTTLIGGMCIRRGIG